MGFDFLSCFGNTTTNCEINLGTLKVPEIKVDTEIPTVELPKPESSDLVIKDTFLSLEVAKLPPPPVTNPTAEEKQAKTPTTAEQKNSDTFQLNSNNQNPSTIFTQSSTIDWSKVTWEVSDISVDAFKADTTYSAKFIENDAALQAAFKEPTKSFTGIFNSDTFQGYVVNDDKWSYNELKDFEKKLTDLETKGQLTLDQQNGLKSLRKECSQIEAIVNRNMEAGLNIEPNSIIDLRLKNGGERFYQDLSQLSNTVKEQEARNSAAKIASENIFASNAITGKNDAEKRIYALADKLQTDNYSSEEARKKDREEFFELYHQLGKAKQDGLEAGGVIDRIMKNEKNLKALKEGYSKDTKEFLNRLEELQKLEQSGKISATDEKTLRNMEKEKKTILELQEKLRNNPEEAYRLHKEITLAFARAGNYEKAAAMSNGESTALDRAEAMNRGAKTEKEKEAAKVNTNILISDKVLREKNKIDSKELNNWIKLKGDLDKVQQEYGLSNDVTTGIKSEMRELYTNDESTYSKYYDNSSSNYYSSSNEGTQFNPGSAEFNLLSKTDQDLILGKLNTETAQKNAVEELTSWGVPKNIAIAIVTNNTELLKEKTKEMSSEAASKYLSLAGLSITENTIYNDKLLGLTIS
jgi:hypothetical protein